jgi:8-oxo-dGTP pyrophosphatase MutT (NUDIX family)
VNGFVIRAAGGVLWRPAGGGADADDIELAVVHRPRYDDWCLPKGKLAQGESDLDAAIREVLEETGFHVRVGEPLGTTRYRRFVNGVDRPKVVRWWAMQASSGAFAPNDEVDKLRWVSLDQARAILTSASDLTALRRFADSGVSPEPILMR